MKRRKRSEGETAAERRERIQQRIRKRFAGHEELALWMRALLFLVGWLLLLLGLAGLVLPGIQGCLTLVAGAAVLSLASEVAYKILRRGFQRWPRGWRRVHRWRSALRRKLVRIGGRKPSPSDRDAETDDQE